MLKKETRRLKVRYKFKCFPTSSPELVEFLTVLRFGWRRSQAFCSNPRPVCLIRKPEFSLCNIMAHWRVKEICCGMALTNPSIYYHLNLPNSLQVNGGHVNNTMSTALPAKSQKNLLFPLLSLSPYGFALLVF